MLQEWKDAKDLYCIELRLKEPNVPRSVARRTVLNTENRKITRSQKARRRKLQKRSVKTAEKFREKLKRLAPSRSEMKPRSQMQAGSQKRLRDCVCQMLNSFDVKYAAYVEARKNMKKSKRPHLYDLERYAQELNMFEPEFEPARTTIKPKTSEDGITIYRTILAFGIHHRARQVLVNWILKACLPQRSMNHQYGVIGKGRDQAVQALCKRLEQNNHNYVAEVDIRNFYPSIGEDYRIITPQNRLIDQLPFLPTAVIESTVLSSGVLSSYKGPRGPLHDPTISNQRGVPQGSATSGFLAEIIVDDIVSKAETLSSLPAEAISYVDNLAVTGEDKDEVLGQIKPLVDSARSSPFGEFGLALSQSVRRKRDGFDFLGYHLRYRVGKARIVVSVSKKSREKFRRNIARQLSAYDSAKSKSNRNEVKISQDLPRSIK